MLATMRGRQGETMDAPTPDAAAPANASTTTATDNAQAATEKPVPVYTKEDLTQKIQREVGKERAERARIEGEFTALQQRVAAMEEEKRAESEAKMSATEREKLARQREVEKTQAEIRTAQASAVAERGRRYALWLEVEASKRLGPVVARVFNPAIVPDVQALVARALSVKEEQGAEYLSIRMPDGSEEPLTDDAWTRFVDARVAPYFRAEGGSGAQHGSGPSTPLDRRAWEGMPPDEQIQEGLRNRARNRKL